MFLGLCMSTSALLIFEWTRLETEDRGEWEKWATWCRSKYVVGTLSQTYIYVPYVNVIWGHHLRQVSRFFERALTTTTAINSNCVFCQQPAPQQFNLYHGSTTPSHSPVEQRLLSIRSAIIQQQFRDSVLWWQRLQWFTKIHSPHPSISHHGGRIIVWWRSRRCRCWSYSEISLCFTALFCRLVAFAFF